MADRFERQVRSIPSNFETREDSEELRIEGYFAVFNSNYEILPGWTESIAPGAFTDTLSGDIRALIDHETRLVLGRTSAHTLELKQDEHGLWGSILINRNDQDAMNLYERVKRGDVNQCSFGFSTYEQDTDVRENGDVHWTLTRVDLDEVSCCTFPAYTDTNISARAKDRDDVRARKMKAWQAKMKERAEKWH